MSRSNESDSQQPFKCPSGQLEFNSAGLYRSLCEPRAWFDEAEEQLRNSVKHPEAQRQFVYGHSVVARWVGHTRWQAAAIAVAQLQHSANRN